MVKFKDFVISNPRIKLEKENKYEFVEMADITAGNKLVGSSIKKQFMGGGSKFQKKDVLFARITPCLEHGKIAQFNSEGQDPAFGSTEFFVFRGISGISNNDYIYYLCLTPMIRKPAEKSMTGASGRQRAKIEAIWEVEINNPGLKTQQKIATVLSNYDNLIENNEKRIKLLEQMAKLIYEEWFVNFKFPGNEKVKMIDSKTDFGEIPEGWEIKTARDLLIRFPAGKKYTQENVLEFGKIPVIDQSEREFLGFHNYSHDHNASSEHPIMIFGDHTCKMRIMVRPFSVGPNTIPFAGAGYSEVYLYFLIRNLVRTQEYKRHWNELIIKKVVVPKKPIIDLFTKFTIPLLRQMNLLYEKNRNLRKTRDFLLPKLISEEVDVSDLDIKISEEVANT